MEDDNKSIPQSIAEQINQHQFENLDTFLKENVDWFAIDDYSFLSREHIRAGDTRIKDK